MRALSIREADLIDCRSPSGRSRGGRHSGVRDSGDELGVGFAVRAWNDHGHIRARKKTRIDGRSAKSDRDVTPELLVKSSEGLPLVALSQQMIKASPPRYGKSHRVSGCDDVFDVATIENKWLLESSVHGSDERLTGQA